MDSALTEFQVELARLFFDLPAAQGFLLAGGAALAAHGLTTRPTQDLDLFTSPGRGDVTAAKEEFIAAVAARGWSSEIVRESTEFCRVVVNGPDSLLVDLAVDAHPGLPPMVSFLGPTFAKDELGGRKLIALFDRAAARDFLDVYVLARSLGFDALLQQAHQIDHGFDASVLADMMDLLPRYRDEDLTAAPDVSDICGMRAYFAALADSLRNGTPPPQP